MTATKAPDTSGIVHPPTVSAWAPPESTRPSRERGAALRRSLRTFGLSAALIVVFVAVWEGYKALGQAWNDKIPGLGWRFPIATDDLSMPHIWTILQSLVQPNRRGSGTSLGVYLLGQTSVTLLEAFVGLVLGTVIGLLFAVAFLYFTPVSRGLMPWLVASQTVPLVAVAPMIVIWGGKLGLSPSVSVTGIAAYLAFFPVTINTLRGLRSPDKVQLELMRSVSARGRQELLWLRFPVAMPYLFAGLRLAATASVVGAIVGELSSGTGSGIGRQIITFTYYYSSGPQKLYAAVLVAALAGIVFVQLLNVVEHFVMRGRRAT